MRNPAALAGSSGRPQPDPRRPSRRCCAGSRRSRTCAARSPATTSSAARSCRRAIRRCCCTSRPITTRRTSTHPRRSIPTASPTTTWRSASARTSASGSNLARLELRVLLDRLLDRLPDIALASDEPLDAPAQQLHQRHRAHGGHVHAVCAAGRRPARAGLSSQPAASGRVVKAREDLHRTGFAELQRQHDGAVGLEAAVLIVSTTALPPAPDRDRAAGRDRERLAKA